MKLSTLSQLTLIMGAVIGGQSLAADEWQITGTPQLWKVQGNIKEAESVSGADLITGDVGMLVSDETRSAQPFTLDRQSCTLRVTAPITLLSGDGKELDLEGIVAVPKQDCYYTTGSHAVSRKTGKVQPDRMHVFRLPTDPATHLIETDSISIASLVTIIQSDEVLRSSLNKPSEDAGLDIEGLTEKSGTLFFGLRSPNLNDQAFIIEVKADDLFAKTSNSLHRTHRLPIGPGLGIRDLAKIKDGFLLITGPTGDGGAAEGYTLQYWAGPNGQMSKIGSLPAPKSAKAEGLLILEETKSEVSVLIFYDGAENGSPTELKLSRHPAGN